MLKKAYDMINFDKLSFYNMVMFHKAELNRIIKDSEYASSVFSKMVRINLRKMGILIHASHKTRCINTINKIHTRMLYPSCLTSMILSGLFDEYDFME